MTWNGLWAVWEISNIPLKSAAVSFQAHKQEFFGTGEVFGNKGTLKMFYVRHAKEESRREKI